MAKQADKQLVVPAPAQSEPTARPKSEEAERYLREAGWQHVGTDGRGETMWEDPAGQGPKRGVPTERVLLENKDGGEPTVIKQLVVGPAPWAYPLVDAMGIQKDRDRAAQKVT